jgi:hypothetical protein
MKMFGVRCFLRLVVEPGVEPVEIGRNQPCFFLITSRLAPSVLPFAPCATRHAPYALRHAPCLLSPPNICYLCFLKKKKN